MRRSLLALVFTICACQTATPAAFWKTYRADLIVAQGNDQGPWGGHLWIHWSSSSLGTFQEAAASTWATSHGWRLVSRVEYGSEALKNWQTGAHEPIFPLFYPSHEPARNSYVAAVRHFPRHIASNLVVLKFTTDWIRVGPGSGSEQPAYGFVVLSTDGTKQAIYHLWGEV